MKNSCHSDWTETLISKADIERTKTDQTTTYYKAIQPASLTGQPVNSVLAGRPVNMVLAGHPVDMVLAGRPAGRRRSSKQITGAVFFCGSRGGPWFVCGLDACVWWCCHLDCMYVCLCCVWRCVWGRPRGLYACVSSVPQALKRVIVWAQYRPGALTRQVAEILLVFQMVL